MTIVQLQRSGGAEIQHRRNDVCEQQLASARLEKNAIVSRALELICRCACLRHARCDCSATMILTCLEFCFLIVWHAFDAANVCCQLFRGQGSARETSIDQGPPACHPGVSVQRSIGSTRPPLYKELPRPGSTRDPASQAIVSYPHTLTPTSCILLGRHSSSPGL